jgi:hypothetical protein
MPMESLLTVVEAAPSQDLTVLETVKLELQVEDTKLDELLQTYIRQASGMIARRCRRVFGKETVSEKIRLKHPYRVPHVMLKRYPVTEIVSVTVDGAELLDAQYEVNGEAGLLYRLNTDCRIDWCARSVTVEYVAGYQLLDELPRDVERACVTAVKFMVWSRTRDPSVKRVEIPDVRTVDYWVGGVGSDPALPPEAVSLITPFIDVRI